MTAPRILIGTAGWSIPRASAAHCDSEGTDPAPAAGAEHPGGWKGVAYFRLHGSPRMYWSRYDAGYLEALAGALRRVPPRASAWCMFDHTASGAAFENAWELQTLLPSQ